MDLSDKTRAHFINEKCFSHIGQHQWSGKSSWDWVATVVFALRSPCGNRILPEHRPSPLHLRMMQGEVNSVCQGPALPQSESLPRQSLPGCSHGRWCRAAVALSRAVHWAGLLRQLCWAPHPPAPLPASPRVWIYSVLWLSGYKPTSNQIKIQLRCT